MQKRIARTELSNLKAELMKTQAKKIELSFAHIGNSVPNTKEKIIKMKEVQGKIIIKIEEAKQLQTEMLELNQNTNFFSNSEQFTSAC